MPLPGLDPVFRVERKRDGWLVLPRVNRNPREGTNFIVCERFATIIGKRISSLPKFKNFKTREKKLPCFTVGENGRVTNIERVIDR